ncbi:unnamed protein product, partial [Ranitomeya imitator]
QVESSDCPGVDSVVDRLQQIWTQVVDNLTLSQEKAQLFANRRRRVGPRLRVGDLVWLSSRHIPMKVSSPKFKPRFIGPYRISEILNPVSFRLTLPDSFSIHNVFHRSLLRRYVAPMVPSVEPPAPVLVEGELEYIVEKILDSRVSRRKLQYLVKWKGYAQEDNSWVFASDVHAPDLVRAFHVAHPGRPGGSACYCLLLEALRSKEGCTAVLLVRHAAAWHWLLQDIVPVYQIKGISKLFKLCLPKVQCFCDSLTSPPSERQDRSGSASRSEESASEESEEESEKSASEESEEKSEKSASEESEEESEKSASEESEEESEKSASEESERSASEESEEDSEKSASEESEGESERSQVRSQRKSQRSQQVRRQEESDREVSNSAR